MLRSPPFGGTACLTMSAKVVAKFVVEELKQKKVAKVHASDTFGNGGRDLVVPALKRLGAEVLLVQGINNGEKDYTNESGTIKMFKTMRVAR
jgi:ABC-type branched-subunit amino acid transport system substrate-binding protein